MNNQIRRIESITKGLLKKSGQQSPPINIEAAAEKVELKIVPFEFEGDISGLLKKDRQVIGVNSKHGEVRQRFTIAHELGHYVLGHGIGDDSDVVDERFDGSQDTEREANIFAACILMPEDLVKAEVKREGLNIEPLSARFQVSKQAMTIRLLDLNLIK